jgi:probable F420-dependent oxidoreductase
MKVGVNLPNYSDGATPESILARARIAESMGFHSVMISDHVAITPSVRPRYPEPFFDPFATLAWLAGQTSRVQLGTTICVVPYRHPVLTARLVANVDRLSGGRFIFGVGVGGAEDEFAALGVPFRRRGVLADEYLDVMRQLWTNPEVTYSGRFVSLRAVSGIPCAEIAGRPHPPIWVGGGSDRALTRALRLGAAWHPNRFAIGWLQDKALPRLRRLAGEQGAVMPPLCPRIFLDLRGAVVRADSRLAGVGSLDQIRDDLKALEALGAEHVILDWYVPGEIATARDDARAWHMLALLAREILDLPGERVLQETPALAASAGRRRSPVGGSRRSPAPSPRRSPGRPRSG